MTPWSLRHQCPPNPVPLSGSSWSTEGGVTTLLPNQAEPLETGSLGQSGASKHRAPRPERSPTCRPRLGPQGGS